MPKIIKNVTASPITLNEVGLTLPSLSSYVVLEREYLLWAADSLITEISPFITAGDIVVNDGINDLSAFHGVEYLKYPDFAFSQRFLSEPERSNSMASKTTQEAIEEARLDIEDNGTLVQLDTDILNFVGGGVNITTDPGERKVNVDLTATSEAFTESLVSVTCFRSPNGCLVEKEVTLLVSEDLCPLINGDC